MRRTGIRLLGLALIAGATLLPIVPARATVGAEVSGHSLNVIGDAADDAVDVTCEAGDVKVNGADPATGPYPCGELTGIYIEGRGGADTMTLEHVGPDDFRWLIPGAMFLIGGWGDDILIGSQIGDWIIGGAGYDTLSGSGGKDELDPGADGATADGGLGHDLVYVVGGGVWVATDTQVEHVSPGPLVIPTTSIESLWIRGGHGDDRIDGAAYSRTMYLDTLGGNDRLIGGSGIDWMSASGGGDRLFGNDGRDRLRGGGGNDVLWGGRGNDRLFGGPGRDHCSAGGGRDDIQGC